MKRLPETLLLLFLNTLFALSFLLVATVVAAAQKNTTYAGAAGIDITPAFPVRLAGFGNRIKKESEGTAQPLHAKALAFGNTFQNTAILITADLIGISSRITDSVKARLAKRVQPSRVTIAVSHTHSGPEIGTLLNILPFVAADQPFDDRLLPVDHITHINAYVNDLINKLEKVANEALDKRQPSLVSWGQGSVNFGFNRRNLDALDQSMPLMKITDLQGRLKAVFVSYACHAVVMGSAFNQFHGDWVGDARRIIEQRHKGAIALVAAGCGGDVNPRKDKNLVPADATFLQLSEQYGAAIADQADSLMTTKLHQFSGTPFIAFKNISLPLEPVPTVKEFSGIAATDLTVRGYYARLALDRIARGEMIKNHVPYPVQVWKFNGGPDIVFLGGEVVTDYALRLKKESRNNMLWIVAYANDVPCYIPSVRHLKLNQYEARWSMYYYNKPAKFKESIETQIVTTVQQLLKMK